MRSRPLALWLLSAILWAPMAAAQVAESDEQPFRIGFSRSLFTDVNDADAKASIKAWSQTVARDRGIQMSPSALLYDHTEEMIEAMQRGSVDAMSMIFDEYIVLSQQVTTRHCFVTQTSGSLFEEYILLVRADAGLTDLRSLEGHSIVFHESARTSLAMDWLDHLVLSTDPAQVADNFFDTIRTVGKISTAVLPVFFGKEDAAVVAQSHFDLMCELNPQLHRTLHTLAKSPPLVPAIMCFRSDYESPEEDRVMEALQDLHQTPAGQQVLTIFKSQRLVLVDNRPLAATASFIEETARLRLAAGDSDRLEDPARQDDGGVARP